MAIKNSILRCFCAVLIIGFCFTKGYARPDDAVNTIKDADRSVIKIDSSNFGGSGSFVGADGQCGCCCKDGAVGNETSAATQKDITEYNGVKYIYDIYSGYYIPYNE